MLRVVLHVRCSVAGLLFVLLSIPVSFAFHRLQMVGLPQARKGKRARSTDFQPSFRFHDGRRDAMPAETNRCRRALLERKILSDEWASTNAVWSAVRKENGVGFEVNLPCCDSFGNAALWRRLYEDRHSSMQAETLPGKSQLRLREMTNSMVIRSIEGSIGGGRDIVCVKQCSPTRRA